MMKPLIKNRIKKNNQTFVVLTFFFSLIHYYDQLFSSHRMNVWNECAQSTFTFLFKHELLDHNLLNVFDVYLFLSIVMSFVFNVLILVSLSSSLFLRLNSNFPLLQFYSNEFLFKLGLLNFKTLI